MNTAYAAIPEGWHLGYLTDCHEDNRPFCCLTENTGQCRDVTMRGDTAAEALAKAAEKVRHVHNLPQGDRQ
jgi:hypothetical protein